MEPTRPGSACEECRRRKVRCDRGRPQCQVCFENGIECKINTTRLPRGPRKGQLRTLRTRIAALERCLADQHPEINHQMTGLFDPPVLDYDADEDLFREIQVPPDSVAEPLGDGSPSESKITASPSQKIRRNELVTDLMRADLDQLYFERVHSFAPILQRWRYYLWAKQPKKCDSQICLQYAMWTLAASMSAQFQAIHDALYQETRRMLDALDLWCSHIDRITTEQAQAWVLISVYEYMHVSYQQAWISTGRCCRLVLGMRLYELDDPSGGPVTMAHNHDSGQVDWAAMEEQRRTFWMAYSLDRFISFHSSLPFTLNEQLISTRLPSPEEEFQAGQPVVSCYLSEVLGRGIDGPSSAVTSSFGECIIVATICGRALSHRQKVAIEQANGDIFDGFWSRHQWLHDVLSHRIQVLSSSLYADPMLIFARIVAQTMVLFLHNILESIIWKTGDHLLKLIECERLSVLAVHEVLGLLKLQAQLGYFKVHPLTSIPLLMCTEFFSAHSYLDPSFDFMLQEVLECLQDLDRVKNSDMSPSPNTPAS
ncbi:fungal-specific transcription factor domain-containing protein [Aspergillus ambiguus]|uniref:Zn(II)2Cys6 transcription factor n=1 Tax=Aspergillus ambiguus TaxID=176160 RepID=UPI003CCCD884